MTFTPDKLPFKILDKSEYHAMQNGELSTQQIIRDLLSKADLEYKPIEGTYNPRTNSTHRRGKYQQQFFVNYSFPVGSETPVASLWACKGEGEQISYSLIHVDLAEFMELIITYYKELGYKVPPPK